MSNEIKYNIKQQSTWLRALYMSLFAVFYGLAEILLFVVIVLQFLLKLFTNKTNARLLKLGQSLATYIYLIIQFLTFNRDSYPYPFDSWPKGEPPVTKKQAEKKVGQANNKEAAE